MAQVVRKILSLDYYSVFKKKEPVKNYFFAWSRLASFGVIWTLQLEPRKHLADQYDGPIGSDPLTGGSSRVGDKVDEFQHVAQNY